MERRRGDPAVAASGSHVDQLGNFVNGEVGLSY
jgi:hypothetical protein